MTQERAFRTDTFADLGDAWLRDQMARLHQAHLQVGQRWHVDVGALLARAARRAREAHPASTLMD